MSVLVLGAGGHAKVLVATLQAMGETVAGCLDDAHSDQTNRVLGVPVVGPLSAIASHDGLAVIGIGSNAVRRQLVETYPGVRWVSVVHPLAVVHPSASVGVGTVVFAGVVVQPDAFVGRHAILNTHSTVDHDSRVGDFAHLAPGVNLSGGVTVAEGALVGVGAACAPGVRVGAWSVVGAGGVVVRDIPPNVTAVGVPARPLMS